MSTTVAVMPVDEYLRLTEKPYFEYRDGVVTQKAMPTQFHAIIQSVLLFLLRGQGVRPLSELTVRVTPTRYLVPDVAVAKIFPGRYPTEPVALCCEILSPDDRLGATPGKCEEYHAWGVPYCWVIDPEKRTAWEYHNGREPVRVNDALRAGELAVSLQELFAELPNS